MDVTTSFVRAKNPCADGFRWFLRNHRDGSDYQQLLDSLVEAARVEDACWLIDQFGATHTVIAVDFLEADAVVFAGAIEARRGIDIGGKLRAGRAIRSGGSVQATGDLVAGEDIRAAGVIRSGGKLQAGTDVYAPWGLGAGGAVHIGGNLKVGGDVECESDLTVSGSATITGDLVVRGDLVVDKGFKVSGAIVVDGSIRAGQGIECASLRSGSHVEAAWGIRAQSSITAGGAIRAGESIASGDEVRAGEGYGIFAGLCVAQLAWESSARVSARCRPAALMSGWWVGTEDACAGTAAGAAA